MSKTHRAYFIGAALLIVSLACGVPALTTIPTPDTNTLSTAIAQTVIAGLTQNAPQQPLFTSTLENTPTLTVTFTPTLTLTETSTSTQTLTPTPTFTNTPSFPMISVSVATNCRIGPGKVYEVVGYLLVGQTAEVYGRDPTNNYWYIRNPDHPAIFCWVWGQYATLSGPFMFLPVFTPPPTPTATLTPTPSPSFTSNYDSSDTCAPAWWANIKLKNTGPIPFKSVDISIHDKATDVIVESLADGFKNVEGCLKTTTKDILGVDDSYLLSSPAFSYDPTGHNLQVIITLCSNIGQKGTCVANKFNFTP